MQKQPLLADYPVTNLGYRAEPHQLAYVLYTSGLDWQTQGRCRHPPGF